MPYKTKDELAFILLPCLPCSFNVNVALHLSSHMAGFSPALQGLPSTRAPCAHGNTGTCKSRRQSIRCQKHPSPLMLCGLQQAVAMGTGMGRCKSFHHSCVTSTGPGPAQPKALVPTGKMSGHCELPALC